MISYLLPVCRGWQENTCIALGIKFLHGNQIHCKQQPLNFTGSCGSRKDQRRWKLFFRSIAQTLTGSQEDHGEIHLLFTTFMLHIASISKLSAKRVNGKIHAVNKNAIFKGFQLKVYFVFLFSNSLHRHMIGFIERHANLPRC